MLVDTSHSDAHGYMLITKGQCRLPFDISITQSTKNESTFIKYIPPLDLPDIFTYHTIPMIVGKGEHRIASPALEMKRIYDLGHDYVGIGMQISVTGDYAWHRNFDSFRRFVEPNENRISIQEHYMLLLDRIYIGIRSFFYYHVLNPTMKLLHVRFVCGESSKNATSEFIIATDHTKVEYKTPFDTIEENKLIVKITGFGAEEREWIGEFTLLNTIPHSTLREFHFQLWRSPIPNYDPNPYEVCFKSNLKYTEYEEIFQLIPARIGMSYEGSLVLGETCNDTSSSSILFQLTGGETDEQIKLHVNGTPIYNKCLQVYDTRFNDFHDVCWKAVKDLGRMDKFNMLITHDIKCPEISNALQSLRSSIRYYLYENVDVDYSQGNEAFNSINITAILSYRRSILNLQAVYPEETVYYHKIHVPDLMPRFQPFTIAESFTEQIFNMFFSYKIPKCLITTHYMHTFDDVVYDAKIDQCYYVAVADVQNHHIYVLYSLADANNDTMDMKVIFHNTVVHIFPESEELIITFNGERVLTDDAVIYTHKILQEKSLTVSVSRFGNAFIIHSDDYGMHLYFDGKVLYIMMSNFYRGRQKGLCGNFDGEKTDEFEGMTGKIFNNASEFIDSFKIEDKCVGYNTTRDS